MTLRAENLTSARAESEVDVRGMSAEEALFEVDNFLSRAIMAGLPSVTVIHGKGTGVLRTAVQQHLRKNKRVKSGPQRCLRRRRAGRNNRRIALRKSRTVYA